MDSITLGQTDLHLFDVEVVARGLASVAQLAHLYDADRAGPVNLFPRRGVGYNSNVPGRHAGESFHEKNACVALWGAPLARREGRPPPRSSIEQAPDRRCLFPESKSPEAWRSNDRRSARSRTSSPCDRSR